MTDIIDQLLKSDEPSIRYKTRVNRLGEDPASNSIRALQEEIRTSARVQKLLEHRHPSGRLEPIKNPYNKWTGAHWVFASLADIGYPAGDESLLPMRDQILECWLNPEYNRETVITKPKLPTGVYHGVPIIEGRPRQHASQHANALWSILKLGLPDGRLHEVPCLHELASLLQRWQWPDGGWNCDKRPKADNSSFFESIIPVRAMALYAKIYDDPQARECAQRAVEVFLRRKLYKRQSDGEIIRKDFVRLHYPCYWEYDILFGLKVMAEGGFISDPRCSEALDLLESKRLPDGGWPSEAAYYHVRGGQREGKQQNEEQPNDPRQERRERRGEGRVELVSWGGVSTRKMNPWVTVDALYVLRAAGRIKQN